jgi:glutamyl-tRNA reductase
MKLELIGLNHVTSALATREKAALHGEALSAAYQRLLALDALEGVIILSTCNRTELYLSPTFHFTDAHLRDLLAELCSLTEAEVAPAYIYRDGAATQHLFRVASGLDSLMIGEVQILSQVKQAYHAALELAASTGILNRCFLQAIECGKMVRNRTGISRGAVSVSFAAVELAQRVFGDLAGLNILLIGAGETTTLTAKHLAENGVQRWRVSNRTGSRGEQLAASIGGIAIAFPPDEAQLAWADIVVSATASPGAVITQDMAARVLQQRKKPILFLDLAVPRDVEPALGGIDDVYLYTVDDFKLLVQANLKEREKEAVRAEALIQSRVEEFVEWYRENRIAPTVQQLQMVLESIRVHEVETNVHRFSPEDREQVDKFSKAMMKKVTGLIVANMKRASLTRNDLSLARAVAVAFSRGDSTDVDTILEKLDHELSH